MSDKDQEVQQRNLEGIMETPEEFQKDSFHDIRNALNSVYCGSQLLEQMLELHNKKMSPLLWESQQKKMILITKRIQQGIRYADQLISGLEKNDLEYEELHFKKQDLRSHLESLVSYYQNMHSKGSRIYELHFARENTTAVYDRESFHRVVENLLHNATKYTEQGLIIVEVSEENGFWTLMVKDSGCGIPDNMIERIFERHVQVGGEHQKTGAGIGLTIVKRYAQLHSGKIQVASTLGKGANFKVLIPTDLPEGLCRVPLTA